MKSYLLKLALLLLSDWLVAGIAQAASSGAVVAWGSNDSDAATVPVAAQSEVVAIAAGQRHTLALIGTAVPLHARRSGNCLVLSWSTNATGFTLQATLDLTPSAIWTDVTNAPALSGEQWTVTNTFSGCAKFYRLRKL